MRMLAGDAGIAAPLSFAEFAAIPGWLQWSEDQQNRLTIIAAILVSADAIERELSGEKLRALVMAAGSDLFDYIAEHYFEAALQASTAQDMAAKLPRPEDLEPLGRSILLRSLPAVLQARYPEASSDPYGRQIAKLACDAIAAFQNHTAALAAEESEA
jgi:hypothetical protein